MRYVWFAFIFAVIAGISVLGRRGDPTPKPPLEFFPDMDRQPKYKPQAESKFFPNGMTDRPVPKGTVPRGRHAEADPAFLAIDDHLHRGHRGPFKGPDTEWIRGFPSEIEINAGLLERGHERYALFCTPCHGQLGDGNGVTKLYGMNPANLLTERVVNMPEGELFLTITTGKGTTMYAYGDRISVADRWAIVAYVRALQRAANGRVDDVPAANRAELGL
jgi:mono/diheme cytochrome c family protein